MGKSSINGPFSMAMLNYQRVCENSQVYYAQLGSASRMEGIASAVAEMTPDIAVITEQWSEQRCRGAVGPGWGCGDLGKSRRNWVNCGKKPRFEDDFRWLKIMCAIFLEHDGMSCEWCWCWRVPTFQVIFESKPKIMHRWRKKETPKKPRAIHSKTRCFNANELWSQTLWIFRVSSDFANSVDSVDSM